MRTKSALLRTLVCQPSNMLPSRLLELPMCCIAGKAMKLQARKASKRMPLRELLGVQYRSKAAP